MTGMSFKPGHSILGRSLVLALSAHHLTQAVSITAGIPDRADGGEEMTGTVVITNRDGTVYEEKDVPVIQVGFEVVKPAWEFDKWPDGFTEACESEYQPPKKKPQPYFGPPKKKSRHDRRRHS